MPMFTEPPYEIIPVYPIEDDWTGARYVIRAPEGAPGGIAAIIGGLGEAEERANAKLFRAAADLYNGCNALIGLIDLVCHRGDMPPQIKAALQTNHRLQDAQATVLSVEAKDADV